MELWHPSFKAAFFLIKKYGELKIITAPSYQVLPLKDLVVFPSMVVPLIIGRKASANAIETAMEEEKLIFLVAQKDLNIEDVKSGDLYRVGVVARILQLIRLPNGLIKILVEGLVGGKVKRFIPHGENLKATVNILEPELDTSDEDEAKKRILIELFKTYIKLNEAIPEEILFTFNQIKETTKITNFICTYIEISVRKKQLILQKVSVKQRIKMLIDMLKKENGILSIKSDLDGKVRDQMLKSQRNFYLQEQLRVIKDELGDEEGENPDAYAVKEKILAAKLPKHALDKAIEEYTRFERIPSMSPESGVIRSYLEWLTALPWNTQTEDRFDMKAVRSSLDKDHYGLKKPKDRIIEYIATLKRVGKIKGSILCLIGPPGVGKTSLGKSIATAINRKFVRMSLGGISDEAEIRGHRKTYIGAMPGKIITAMKRAQSVNPVILLDEIDKLGSDFRGDPSSALLEVLDPEQNNQFVDHYLEVEYDLSNVLFVLTANNREDIPDALYDRLEVIDLYGYHDKEKMHIATDYIIKKALENHGIEKEEITIEADVLEKIITEYTAEPGVRNLERSINTICRKAIVELAENKRTKQIVVTVKKLEKYLGVPKYKLENLIKKGEKGVALGLAWTAYGGDVLPIEVNLLAGKDKLSLTGNLGDVMQESAQIAISFLRSKARKYKIDPSFNMKHEIHIHLPEGAIPKEGPSAGIALTTALLSALTKKAFPTGLAMTGEVTLRGKVLAIGGLNEKLLAAKRVGIKEVIIPKQNKKDMVELDKEIYEGLNIIYAEHYDQVFDHIFKQ